jgi:hypothetical protein
MQTYFCLLQAALFACLRCPRQASAFVESLPSHIIRSDWRLEADAGGLVGIVGGGGWDERFRP